MGRTGRSGELGERDCPIPAFGQHSQARAQSEHPITTGATGRRDWPRYQMGSPGNRSSKRLSSSGMLWGAHFEAISFGEGAQGLGVSFRGPAKFDEFGEVVLEARRRNNLKDSRVLVTGVPERVPLMARLKIRSPGPPDQHVVAKQRPDTTFDDVAILVLARMPMQRCCQCPARHRVSTSENPPRDSPP